VEINEIEEPMRKGGHSDTTKEARSTISALGQEEHQGKILSDDTVQEEQRQACHYRSHPLSSSSAIQS
jgi:hypothetical protein